MGLFVDIVIDSKRCAPGCTLCLDSCPMKIFLVIDGKVNKRFEQEDECTFCNVCLERCRKNTITINKNY